MSHTLTRALILSLLLPALPWQPVAAQAATATTVTTDAAATAALTEATGLTSVTSAQSLGSILQQAIDASDELSIIRARIHQAQSGIKEARGNYYPQVTLTERVGRDASYPSSARTPNDPRGQSEYVNANSTKLEINQMVFDGFKTPAEIERQELTLAAIEHRYRTASQQVVRDTLDVYLTAWRHLQALRAGVAMVEDLRSIKSKIDLQVEAGATDQTVQSYVDSRLTGATQELLKTRNAYREALYRLGFLLQQNITPEAFGFQPLLAPTLLEVETYLATARENSPELLEERANKNASEQELRKANAPYYPTLSLTSDLQDTNDIGGSVGTVRTGNAMVQVSYKIFDGYAARHGKARVKSQITENEHRLRRTTRRLEEDLSQAWRKAVASQQEADLSGKEAAASLKVKTLRSQDVENGQGDIVRLVEAEEALYTSILRQLDLVQNVTGKRYEITIMSGKLADVACVDGGCADIPMAPVEYINPVEVAPAQTIADTVSTTSVVSSTENLLPAGTEAPVTPAILGAEDTSTTQPVSTTIPQDERPVLPETTPADEVAPQPEAQPEPQPEPQSEPQPQPEPQADLPQPVAEPVSPPAGEAFVLPVPLARGGKPVNALENLPEVTVPAQPSLPTASVPEEYPSAQRLTDQQSSAAAPRLPDEPATAPQPELPLPDVDAPRDFEAPPPLTN